ncbi:uncharacterized protein [Haliotis cracherodii]|uniref:uncharacterized protein n=1 Tax=Haliotis cracherodii TaxID=6455 RepID=UPI0039EAC657
MSFGSAIRFELDTADKPLVFWQLAKDKKTSRKFDYKSRNQRFPPRRLHFEEHCDECRYNTSHKHSHTHQPRTNFVKKNITNIRSKYHSDCIDHNEKPFANNVINRCTPRRRNPNSITLTDMQLNTLLDAVRNMSPSSQNTIRFKLDGKLNEIQVNSNSDKDSQEGESAPYTKQSQATVSEKTYDLDPAVTGKELVPVGRHLELERPRGVDRSGIFDGGSLSPIMDELESTSEGKPYGSTADKDDR